MSRRQIGLTIVAFMLCVATFGAGDAEAMMGNRASAFCDGVFDCIATAYWWAFLR